MPYPELPPFEFTFDKEIDPVKLPEELSYESYVTLLDVLGYVFPTEEETQNLQQKSVFSVIPSDIFNNFNSYGKIAQEIDNTLVYNNEMIIDNTVPTKPVRNVGGILVPVKEIPPAYSDNMYGFYTIHSGLTSVYTIKLKVPVQWEAVSIKITIINQ